MNMNTDELLEMLENGITFSVKLLVRRAKEGKASASEIAQLRGLFKDAGGALTFGSHATPAGQSVLDSLSDVDPELFN